MAITKITPPSATTPILAGQYTQQNKKINANTEGHAPDDFVLTDLVSTVAAPLIGIGCYIRHAGNSYQVDTADEAISGSVSAGLNYVKLTVSGSVLLASWVTSFSGHLYNEAYGGWYAGTTTQILPQGVYLDGTTYNRMKCIEVRNKSVFTLGDGSDIRDDTAIRNVSGSFLTGGDDIDTGGGDVTTGVLGGQIRGYNIRALNRCESDYGYLYGVQYISSSVTADDVFDELSSSLLLNPGETTVASGMIKLASLVPGSTDYFQIYAIKKTAIDQITILGSPLTFDDIAGTLATSFTYSSIFCNNGDTSTTFQYIHIYL